MRPYLKDPETIYARSFAIVRREARLDRFDPDMTRLATRVIHAWGMPDIADRIAGHQNRQTGYFPRQKIVRGGQFAAVRCNGRQAAKKYGLFLGKTIRAGIALYGRSSNRVIQEQRFGHSQADQLFQ